MASKEEPGAPRIRKWLTSNRSLVDTLIYRQHSKIQGAPVSALFIGVLSMKVYVAATTASVLKSHKWMCDTADRALGLAQAYLLRARARPRGPWTRSRLSRPMRFEERMNLAHRQG